MAATIGLSPLVVERTSNEPQIRSYYGEATIPLPMPDELREWFRGILCCTCANKRTSGEVPMKTSSLPGPQSPKIRAQ